MMLAALRLHSAAVLRPRRLCFLAIAVLGCTDLQADCSLTATGNVPLNDLGPASYKGFTAGLYPGGANTRPAAHDRAGIEIATNQIRPLNAAGSPDPANGRIVMISIGMSNTTQEFASKGPQAFKPRADADASKNPQLVIVDGAQGGKDAAAWGDPNAATWATVNQRLAAAGVTPRQVQIAWVKAALARPNNYGAFPAHAQALQSDLAAIIRNLKINYPNIRISYLSTRTRAYTDIPTALNPEPFAYENGFAVKWTMQDQIEGKGNLNFDPARGPVVAPFIAWGPYIWADGLTARSDGFTWLCSDLESDFTHPSAGGGVRKVADQLLAFFKTDPTATPWFLRKTTTGQVPEVTASASVTSGPAPLRVNFTASANDPDGSNASYQWTFDDGTFSTAQNPAKIFPAPGAYNARLTVTDNSGNTVRRIIPIHVAPQKALLNLSTRLRILSGDRALIGGFIITGTEAKKVIIRGLGPSLSSEGVVGALQDPTLELFDGAGVPLASNDNWKDSQQSEIEASTIPPRHDAESAILRTLAPGNYTAVVRGSGDGTGIGLVEVFDLSQAQSKLANISSRGGVEAGENVMIGGFIVGGDGGTARVIVRALGPSLRGHGISDFLADPTLELVDANGSTIRTNDNWKTDQQAELEALRIAPNDDLEAALVTTLTGGSYTAIVRGKDDSTGVGLVEVYNVQ